MAQATIHFPRGFLWGAATSSHQVEGNQTNNNWSAWEQQPGRIIHGHQSGLACDWWNGRWREDFDRAANSNHNTHRFSIEWSRVQPSPDHWDEDALDRYLEMLRGLQERGLTSMITLHHFTNPLWLEEQGGWENPEVADFFEKYVRRVVETLKEYNNLWITINEPNVYGVEGYMHGTFPPGKRDPLSTIKVFGNLLRAHAMAYHAIHSLQPNAQVGIAINYRSLKAAKTWFLPDRWVVDRMAWIFNEAIPRALQSGVLRLPFNLPFAAQRIPHARGTQDYLGINYYTRDYVKFDLRAAGELFGRRFFRPGVELSDTGFLANEPEGIFEAIRWGRRFNLPMWITENGVENAEDRLRPRYIAEHIHQMWRAVNFNYYVKGYFHWTLVDNFEWERGWTQRFGLWELDVNTQGRRKRPSADLYAEICRENGLSADMVARYAPEIFSRLFPN
jgi:beta-glucosidase